MAQNQSQVIQRIIGEGAGEINPGDSKTSELELELKAKLPQAEATVAKNRNALEQLAQELVQKGAIRQEDIMISILTGFRDARIAKEAKADEKMSGLILEAKNKEKEIDDLTKQMKDKADEVNVLKTEAMLRELKNEENEAKIARLEKEKDAEVKVARDEAAIKDAENKARIELLEKEIAEIKSTIKSAVALMSRFSSRSGMRKHKQGHGLSADEANTALTKLNEILRNINAVRDDQYRLEYLIQQILYLQRTAKKLTRADNRENRPMFEARIANLRRVVTHLSVDLRRRRSSDVLVLLAEKNLKAAKINLDMMTQVVVKSDPWHVITLGEINEQLQGLWKQLASGQKTWRGAANEILHLVFAISSLCTVIRQVAGVTPASSSRYDADDTERCKQIVSVTTKTEDMTTMYYYQNFLVGTDLVHQSKGGRYAGAVLRTEQPHVTFAFPYFLRHEHNTCHPLIAFDVTAAKKYVRKFPFIGDTPALLLSARSHSYYTTQSASSKPHLDQFLAKYSSRSFQGKTNTGLGLIALEDLCSLVITELSYFAVRSMVHHFRTKYNVRILVDGDMEDLKSRDYDEILRICCQSLREIMQISRVKWGQYFIQDMRALNEPDRCKIVQLMHWISDLVELKNYKQRDINKWFGGDQRAETTIMVLSDDPQPVF